MAWPIAGGATTGEPWVNPTWISEQRVGARLRRTVHVASSDTVCVSLEAKPGSDSIRGGVHSMTRPQQRIIVIGGSAGALRPLKKILASLPANLPAAVFVVIHIAPYAGNGILEHLCELTSMKSLVGRDGVRFGDGEIIFAPP